MSSDQKQQEKDFNLQIGLSVFNTQVVHSMFSEKTQQSLLEKLDRRESSPSNTLPPSIDYQDIRRSSTPTIIKQVGSNRYFSFLVIYLSILSSLFICRFFMQPKK